MAKRRMVAKEIVGSDAFMDMPLSTQALYFHLITEADDDGFISAARKIQRMIGANDDDLRLLIAKGFLIAFENGVCVIKHWLMQNQIRKDRYKATVYFDEKSRLYLKSNGAYTLDESKGTPLGNQMETNGLPNGNQMETQYSIDKNSIDEFNTIYLSEPDEEENSEFSTGFSTDFSTREDAKRSYLQGELGRGVVMLSNEQMDILLDFLSIEEFDHYVSVVAHQIIEKGRKYGKTHYQAIMEMAAKDRQVKR